MVAYFHEHHCVPKQRDYSDKKPYNWTRIVNCLTVSEFFDLDAVTSVKQTTFGILEVLAVHQSEVGRCYLACFKIL